VKASEKARRRWASNPRAPRVVKKIGRKVIADGKPMGTRPTVRKP
jgi:hypothetical protein